MAKLDRTNQLKCTIVCPAGLRGVIIGKQGSRMNELRRAGPNIKVNFVNQNLTVYHPRLLGYEHQVALLNISGPTNKESVPNAIEIAMLALVEAQIGQIGDLMPRQILDKMDRARARAHRKCVASNDPRQKRKSNNDSEGGGVQNTLQKIVDYCSANGIELAEVLEKYNNGGDVPAEFDTKCFLHFS